MYFHQQSMYDLPLIMSIKAELVIDQSVQYQQNEESMRKTTRMKTLYHYFL